MTARWLADLKWWWIDRWYFGLRCWHDSGWSAIRFVWHPPASHEASDHEDFLRTLPR